MFVCVLSPASIFVFSPNFEPLLHLKYMKISIEDFSPICRYGKYISFAILITLVTALGPEQFAFPKQANYFYKIWDQNLIQKPFSYRVFYIYC